MFSTDITQMVICNRNEKTFTIANFFSLNIGLRSTRNFFILQKLKIRRFLAFKSRVLTFILRSVVFTL